MLELRPGNCQKVSVGGREATAAERSPSRATPEARSPFQPDGGSAPQLDPPFGDRRLRAFQNHNGIHPPELARPSLQPGPEPEC